MQEANVAGLELGLLPALDALLACASVTGAAERIGKSQPAMSRILSRLRDQLADPLLVREGGEWKLTPRAESLRAPLENILAQVSQLYGGQAFDPLTASREFRLAVPDVVAAILFPALQALLAQEAPGCRVIIVPWPRRDEGAVDVDLAIGADMSIFPGFRVERLFEDRDVGVYRETDGEPTALFERPHVAVVPRGFQADPVDIWLGEQEHRRIVGSIVPNYLQAIHLVSQTALLAILPERFANALGPQLGVATVELPIAQESETYWLFCPSRLAADDANRWLRGCVHRGMAATSVRFDRKPARPER